MGRFIHHDQREVEVVVRDAAGEQVGRSHRATGLIGSPTLYGAFVRGLRSKLEPGQWLDTADADAAHEQLLEVRRDAIAQLQG